MAFDPDVATATVIPVAFDPVSMWVGGLLIASGDPDVTLAIPAVIAVMPGPITVLGWGWGNDFDGARWRRADADDDLGAGRKCAGQKDETES
jgi:hypothetical protein